MKKIIIVGTSGCGKTTLARKLSALLDITSYDLDDYYWKTEWQINESFSNSVATIINRKKWIISGNYAKYREMMWQQADKVIWLDYSFSRCLFQATVRSIKLILSKEKRCNGNVETIRRLFSYKNSIASWIIQTYKRRQQEYDQIFSIKNNTNKKFLRFKSPKELDAWINYTSILKN